MTSKDHRQERKAACCPTACCLSPPSRQRKTRVDEAGAAGGQDSGDEGGGDEPERSGVDELARELLRGVSELPFVPVLPQVSMRAWTVPQVLRVQQLWVVLVAREMFEPARAFVCV